MLTQTTREHFAHGSAIGVLVLIELRLRVQNPQKTPIFGPNAEIPAKSLQSNDFLTARNRQTISIDHAYKIGVNESIVYVIFRLRRRLEVGMKNGYNFGTVENRRKCV
jgi:hypothetical protein